MAIVNDTPEYTRLINQIDSFIETYGDDLLEVKVTSSLATTVINEIGENFESEYKNIPIIVDPFLSGSDIQKILKSE